MGVEVSAPPPPVSASSPDLFPTLFGNRLRSAFGHRTARHTLEVEINEKLPDDAITVYEAVGGVPFFEQLAAGFYEHVRNDDVLLQLYPDPDDLAPAQQRLMLFLVQYFGGPTIYSEQRGHPRLRMRHAPYAIGDIERDHWLRAMMASLDDLHVSSGLYERFSGYFVMAADAMKNQ
jgi:hemoglobin